MPKVDRVRPLPCNVSLVCAHKTSTHRTRDGQEVELIADSTQKPAEIDFSDNDGGGIDFGGDDGGGIDFGGDDSGGIDFGGGDSGIDFGGDDAGGIDFGADEAGGIDFGDDGGGIDFGDDGGGIDFGDDSGIDFGDGGGIDFTYDTATIDFSDTGNYEIVCEASGTEKKKMTETEANQSLLDSSEHRSEVVNEFMELEAFLSQRIADMDKKTSAQTFNDYQNAPELVQQTGNEQLSEWKASVGEILSKLNSSETRQLIQIVSSEGQVQRLTDALVKKHDDIQKFRQQAKDMEAKESSLQEAVVQTHQSLKHIVTKVRELKGFVEEILGKQKGYGDCKFQLVGAINTVR